MNEKERIWQIDMARGLAILLVVIGHLGMKNEITRFIYSFHMPLFFVISGMTIDNKKTIGSFISDRFFSILVPYYLFSLIFSNGSYKSFLYCFYGSRNSLLCAESLTPLWFLPVLFLMSSLFYVIVKLFKNRMGGAIVGVTVSCLIGVLLNQISKRLFLGLPMGLEIAFFNVPFILMGYLLIHCYRLRVLLLSDKHKSIRIGLCGVFFIITLFLYRFNLPESVTEGFNHVELSISSYGMLSFFYITSVTGICFVLILSSLKKIELICKYGRATLTCLVSHGVVINVSRYILGKFSIESSLIVYLVSFLGVLVTVLPINCILKKLVPNLVGIKNYSRDG